MYSQKNHQGPLTGQVVPLDFVFENIMFLWGHGLASEFLKVGLCSICITNLEDEKNIGNLEFEDIASSANKISSKQMQYINKF